MEILERRKSSKLLSLEAVLRRLPETDREYGYYRDLYYSQKKGYEGEIYVDRLWREMNISAPYFLFHNYETTNHAGNTHQIDTLLLTAHFIWLLEIKNISGRIDIDKLKHQMVRTNHDGSINAFKNPLNQIKRHSDFLHQKLREWNIPLPIEPAIIIVNDSTFIGDTPKEIPIFHSSGMQSEIDRLLNKHNAHKIKPSQTDKLQMEVVNSYRRRYWKPKVNSSKLRKGVLCKNCGYKSLMEFEYGSFKCVACKIKSKDAHLEALIDYRYLNSEWISNRELREYLNIPSRDAAKRILIKMNLKYTGAYKYRKYKIPDFFT